MGMRGEYSSLSGEFSVDVDSDVSGEFILFVYGADIDDDDVDDDAAELLTASLCSCPDLKAE